jgi:hypothetical protein
MVFMALPHRETERQQWLSALVIHQIELCEVETFLLDEISLILSFFPWPLWCL